MTKGPKLKALVDSSAVLGVVCGELFPELASQLPRPSNDCHYWTSPYLRMEFLRRWIIDGIRLYITARQREAGIAGAIAYWSNGWGRRPTVVGHWAAIYANRKVRSDTTPQDETEQFGRLVYTCARTYDLALGRMISTASTGCKKGQLSFSHDWETIRDSLKDFFNRFTSDDFTCRLGQLLRLERGCPAARAFLEATWPKGVPSNTRSDLSKLRDNLTALIEKSQPPDCRGCSKLGDLLIALEQPPTWTLYHTDRSFDTICELLKKAHCRLDCAFAASPQRDVLRELFDA